MKLRLCVAAVALLAQAAPARPQPPESGVLQVRAATGRFHRVESAEAAGYARFQDCTSQPGQGAMGIHYVNGTYVGDAELDPTRPEALMYEPQPDGRLVLVGAEFIVFASNWNAVHATPPTLFGHELHLVPEPNRYSIPAFYELHVWAWRENPAGTFEDWNPTVTCP